MPQILSGLTFTYRFSYRWSTRPGVLAMPKDRFAENPYPDLQVSAEERHQLVDLVNGFLEVHFQKYEDFVVVDNRRVDEQRWKHFKTKDNLHVYEDRCRKDDEQGMEPWKPDTAQGNTAPVIKDLPVMLRVGTVVGHLDDLMLGVVNPTLDVMRVKASYVHDLDAGAILCPIVEPTEEEPFRSLIIKWMTIDVPLQSTSLVKVRDFVYIEATGVLHFANGDHVGYHLIHSIEFPQTKPRPNIIRANLSYFSFFRQIEDAVVDVFGTSTVAPGGDVMRFISIRVATEALLSSTNLVFCGQMKKMSWMLQHRHSADRQSQRNENCVMCGKKTTSVRGRLGKSTCKLCYGCVCYSCKIRRRITFIGIDGTVVQRKIAFCSKCISTATVCDAKKAAIDQAAGYRAYKASSTSSHSDTAEISGIE
ncbi:unnamed protein product [Phytophthora fragariaefolia]|uniref:Unnamed protein product n=1 Tax=Phytophthora fragariaefolia TaxID=1490495 RepID=A0A9W6YBJ9_9STRA|nr:unnamed protein product [Phytophthora fragariaefolia]